MSMEAIASMSHRVSIVPYIAGAKKFLFLFNYDVPLKIFEKIYVVTEFEHDIEKKILKHELCISNKVNLKSKEFFWSLGSVPTELCKKFHLSVIGAMYD